MVVLVFVVVVVVVDNGICFIHSTIMGCGPPFK